MTIFCYKMKNNPLTSEGFSKVTYRGNYYKFEFVECGKSLAMIDWPFPLLITPEEALYVINKGIPFSEPTLRNLAWNWYLRGRDLCCSPEPGEKYDDELYLMDLKSSWDFTYFEWLLYNKDKLRQRACKPYIEMKDVDRLIMINSSY